MTVKYTFNKKHEAVGITFPAYLFRYMRDTDYVVDSILRPALWFSKLDAFNDPLEIESRIRRVASDPRIFAWMKRYSKGMAGPLADPKIWKIIASSETAMEMLRSYYSDAMDAAFQMKLDEVAICCSSDRGDIPLMWGHYADGHRGLCLVLDTMFLMNGQFGLQEVRYLPRVASWNHASRRMTLGDSDEFMYGFDQAFWLPSPPIGNMSVSID